MYVSYTISRASVLHSSRERPRGQGQIWGADRRQSRASHPDTLHGTQLYPQALGLHVSQIKPTNTGDIKTLGILVSRFHSQSQSAVLRQPPGPPPSPLVKPGGKKPSVGQMPAALTRGSQCQAALFPRLRSQTLLDRQSNGWEAIRHLLQAQGI